MPVLDSAFFRRQQIDSEEASRIVAVMANEDGDIPCGGIVR